MSTNPSFLSLPLQRSPKLSNVTLNATEVAELLATEKNLSVYGASPSPQEQCPPGTRRIWQISFELLQTTAKFPSFAGEYQFN